MASFLLTRIIAPQSQMRGRRLLHVCRALSGVDKSHLAKLRKKTGFAISNCKQALEMHNNDFEKAEAWLQAEAQAHGWEKATKLSGRKTAQGLVGIHIEGNVGAIVEVNCETDFVARNEKFKTLVAKVARECMSCATPRPHYGVIKEALSEEHLKDLLTSEGKTLGDLLALSIGTIGENMSLPRAVRIQGSPGIQLVGISHPSTLDQNLQTGKYGVILALKSSGELTEVARQLCVHVIGMNPKAIGTISDPKASNPDDETTLIHQEFLSDPTKTVDEMLQEENIEIVDFVRFESGEQTVNIN